MNGGTVIYFDYGGYYSDDGNDVRWNRKESHVYSLLHKGSMEEITYVWLVGRICKKIMLDEATTKLKISYFPLKMDPMRQSYIFDDEDVVGYLMQLKNEQCKSVLHVELIENVSVDQNWEHNVRVDQGSGINVRNEEFASDGRGNKAIIPLDSGWEPWERYENVDIVPYISNGEYPRDEDVPRDEDDPCGEDDPCDEDDRRDEDYTREEDHTRDVVACVDNHVTREVEWEDGLNFALGQEFGTKQEVIDLVERAIHLNCFEINIVKSTTVLYVVNCKGVGCKWSLRVAKLRYSTCFSVRTYNKMHTCSRTDTSTTKGKRKGTPRLVASILHEDYPGRFDTPTPKSLIGMVQGRLGVKVSYTTAWRGKQQAANDVRGSPEESYRLMPSYLYMLEAANPGSVTRLELDEEQRFKYLFVALGACIEGFQFMRKVIVVDGTHLKNLYGGVLIIASCQDPDRHHYPIAFGVVDGEKDVSWRWFLNMLKTIIPDDPENVFVSDRNQSIIKTIGEVYPMSLHGYCAYHISQNVKSHVSGAKKDDVANKFMECATAYTEREFNILYDAFRNKYPKAAEYLDESLDVRKWARCYFPGARYNINTTNTVEGMNGVLNNARKYSLMPMLDAIVATISEWFNKHRKSSVEVPSTQKLVPYVEKELHTRCQIAKLLTVIEINSFMREYNVLGQDGMWYLVNLRQRTCSCKHFDIDKYACVHAVAAVMECAKSEELHVFEVCSTYYHMHCFLEAYCRTIYRVPDRLFWNVPDDIKALSPLPPPYIKKKGRRKEKRFPSVGESRRRNWFGP